MVGGKVRKYRIATLLDLVLVSAAGKARRQRHHRHRTAQGTEEPVWYNFRHLRCSMGNSKSKQGSTKEHLVNAEKTGRLGLAGRKLKEVPPRVWLMAPKLRSLDLGNNSLERLPTESV